VQEFKLGAVLLLSGVDLSNRADAQMRTATYKVLPLHSPSLSSTALSIVSQLPTYTFAPGKSRHSVEVEGMPESSDSEVPFIPGGGLTRRLLSSIPSSWSIPTASVVQFVMEGDNRPDAEVLASIVAQLLQIHQFCKVWKQPPSWREGLFGTPHDQTLFG